MSYLLVKESDIIDVNYDLWKLNLKEYLRRRGRVPPSFLTTLPVPFPFVTSSRHAAQRHRSSTSQSTPLWTKIYSTQISPDPIHELQAILVFTNDFIIRRKYKRKSECINFSQKTICNVYCIAPLSWNRWFQSRKVPITWAWTNM
jgi:hypothetical protein